MLGKIHKYCHLCWHVSSFVVCDLTVLQYFFQRQILNKLLLFEGKRKPFCSLLFCHFTTWLPFLIFTRKTANCFYNQKPFSSLLPQLFKSDALFLTETAEKKNVIHLGNVNKQKFKKIYKLSTPTIYLQDTPSSSSSTPSAVIPSPYCLFPLRM